MNHPAEPRNIHTEITSEPITTGNWLEWAKHPYAGAVVFFGGITRDTFDDRKVRALSYDCYVPRAEKTLRSIAEVALGSPGVQKVVLIHRIGVVPLSEESVCIVVSASHRHQGWQTAEKILEDVKSQAEIWKKEEFEDGPGQWVQGCTRCHGHGHE